MSRTRLLPILTALMFAACRRPAVEDSGTVVPGGAVTLWTDSTELFMEYPALFTDTPSRLAVHLTDLSDFSPLRGGRVTLRFQQRGSGETVEASQDAPRSPGIYGLEVTFPAGGTWDLVITVSGSQVVDRIEVPGLLVLDGDDESPAVEDAPAGEIAFLKEQQWKTPGFATAFAGAGTLSASIEAPGEIVPPANRVAIVTAPVAGLIDATTLVSAPLVGEAVAAGTDLIGLLPALGEAGAALADAQADLENAEAEFLRAQRLVAAEAAPRRRLVEAEVARDRARQAMAGLGGGMVGGRLRLRAPIPGVVAQRHVVAGARVAAGDPLFTIVDPSVVWVRSQVPAARIRLIGTSGAARFRLEGETTWRTTGRRIATGPLIDSLSRTLPVVWEMANPGGIIPLGATATVSVPAGGSISGVIVPASAVLEEDGLPVTYVQVTGESFARRPVVLGGRSADRVVITDGLREGDRVVTGATYQVRLASLGGSVPAHGHEH
jgi:RND family efflux transporter MFP subunit